MKKIIPAILLIAGLLLAVKGIQTIQSATAGVKLLGLEINASDESGQTAGIMYLLLGVGALIGSYMTWKK